MIQLNRILFPTDFSELSVHALSYARAFAEAYDAELHVLHVVDEAYAYWLVMGPNSLPAGPPPEELAAAAEKQMDKFVSEKISGAGMPIVKHVRMGRPFLEIIHYAREQDIDLIVLGTHGRSGLRHALLGSVAERVVRKAPCPVLTIRHPEHDFVMP